MMASSTTAPSAMTSPASVIVLIVSPRQCSTSSVAISDSGMVSTLISATRHSKRNSARMTIDQHEAEHQGLGEVVDGGGDEVGLLEDRRVELDPGHPGLERPDGLLDALGHLHGVGPGQLLDHQQHARGRR